MRRIQSIDGVRGIAALAVVVYHGFVPTFDALSWWLHPGFLGVRLFFVLSGALISNVLWSMHEDRDSFGWTWRRFAYRRALRILPLAYLTMLIVWWVGMPAMLNKPWWYLTFTQNIGRGLYVEWPVGLGHFWTLAVEEQVYALWPIAVLLVPIKRWPIVAVGVIAATTLGRFTAWHVELWGDTWTFLFLDGFAAGSLVAWSQRHDIAETVTTRLAAAGLITIAFAIWVENNAGWAVLETGAILMLAAGVGWAWSHPHQRLLAWRPIVWVGTISYGVYVWHEAIPAILWWTGHLPFSHGWRMFALKLTCGIGGAAMTWYVFERPINRLKDRARTVIPTATRHATTTFS